MLKAIACAFLVGLVLFALVADRRIARRQRVPRWFASPLLSSVMIATGVSALVVVLTLEIKLMGEVTWSWFLEVPLAMAAASGVLAALAARFLISDRSAEPPKAP